MNEFTNVATLIEGEIDIESLPQYPVTAWFRVVAQNSGSLELTNAEYESDIKSKIEAWHEQLSFAAVTLGGVVDSLKNSIEYNSVYNSFLLGQISEDEFTEDAANFAFDPIEIEAQQLFAKVDILLSYTHSEFTTSEIGEIFHVPEESVGLVVEQLQLNLDRIEQVALPFSEN